MKTLPVSELLKQLPHSLVAPLFGDSISPNGPEFNDVSVHGIKYLCHTKDNEFVYAATKVINGNVNRVFASLWVYDGEIRCDHLNHLSGCTDRYVSGFLG